MFWNERKRRVCRFTSEKRCQRTVIWFSSKTSPNHIPQMKTRSSWKIISLPTHQHSGDMKITIRCFRTQMGWLLADRKAVGNPIATGLSKSPTDSYQRSDATTARRSAKHGPQDAHSTCSRTSCKNERDIPSQRKENSIKFRSSEELLCLQMLCVSILRNCLYWNHPFFKLTFRHWKWKMIF